MTTDAPLSATGLPLSSASFQRPDYVVPSSWLEHAPFLSWLVETVAPARIVQLGCGDGFAYFTLCQAVERLGLATACAAVDPWRGGPDDPVGTHNAACYQAFSHLVPDGCADAAARFADGSVDLLVVDRAAADCLPGDLSAWRTKLSPHAVVLLHPFAPAQDDGIAPDFPGGLHTVPRFAFEHGGGLALLAPGAVPVALASLLGAEAGAIRAAYAALGRAVSEAAALRAAEAELGRRDSSHTEQLGAMQRVVTRLAADRDAARCALEQQATDLVVADSALDRMRQRRAAELAALAGQRAEIALDVAGYQARIAALAARVGSGERALAVLRDEAAQTDARIASLQGHAERLRTSEAAVQAARAEADLTVAALRAEAGSRQAAHEAAMLALRAEADLTAAALRDEAASWQAAYHRLAGSVSWRLTRPLRGAVRRSPRQARAAVAVLRLGWWAATFQFARIAARLRAR